MTVILTNDDGIDAPGIRALLKCVSERAVIVAPVAELSGCSHQVTTGDPIRVERRGTDEYAVTGTPADCVRLGVKHLCPEAKLVIAGINSGGNLGVDAYISGTIAAVREAAFLGVPGIAISQYRKGGRPVEWELTLARTAYVLSELLGNLPRRGSFWNVNLPYLEPGDPEPDIIFCEPSTEPLPVKFRVEGDNFYYDGRYEMRDRSPGSDVDVCFSGNIAVTKISL